MTTEPRRKCDRCTARICEQRPGRLRPHKGNDGLWCHGKPEDDGKRLRWLRGEIECTACGREVASHEIDGTGERLGRSCIELATRQTYVAPAERIAGLMRRIRHELVPVDEP